MGILRKISNALNPKKAEFAKRLYAKRQAMASNPIFAGMATKGTPEYNLRLLGLECIEYAVIPEATIVGILEIYWEPHIANFYTSSSFPFVNSYAAKPGSDQDQINKLAKKRVNDLAAHIEYKITGNPQAYKTLPEFEKFIDYIRYKVKIEHPRNPYLGEEF